MAHGVLLSGEGGDAVQQAGAGVVNLLWQCLGRQFVPSLPSQKVGDALPIGTGWMRKTVEDAVRTHVPKGHQVVDPEIFVFRQRPVGASAL